MTNLPARARYRRGRGGFEELSFTSTLTELNGEWAVTYELRYLDKDPENSSTPLFMTIKGFMYVHPYWKTVSSMPSTVNEEAQLNWTVLSIRWDRN